MVMEIDRLIQRIDEKIAVAKNILVIGHQKPDADSLGSICAFGRYLDKLGKNYSLFCLTPPSGVYNFLSGIEKIQTDFNQIASQVYELVIVFDSGDLVFAGVKDLLPSLKPAPFIINIDHHATNQNYGQINLVIPAAVSTTEVIYRYFDSLHIEIDKETAVCLMVGILGDTNYFTNHNTSEYSFQVAASLVLAGAALTSIYNYISKNKQLDTLKLWGKVLSRLFKNKEYGIAITLITQADLEELKIDADNIEGVANFLNNLTDVRASLVLTEQPNGTIKGSLRTNDPLLDLTKLVKILGGGGHPKAAGFTIKGRLKNTEQGWQIV